MKNIFTVLLVLLIAGCSYFKDPKSVEIPNDLSTDSAKKEFAELIKKLDEKDKELFTSYFMRIGMAKALNGAFGVDASKIKQAKTVGEAIEIQKSFEAEQAKIKAEEEQLKQKQKAEAEAITTEIAKSFTYVYVKKLPIVKDEFGITSSLPIMFAIKNKSDSVIAGYKGQVTFTDQFGEKIASVSFEGNKDLQPQEESSETMNFDLMFSELRKLNEISDDKVSATTTVTHLIFKDGKKLVMPGQDV